jgi:hypothetical protein
MYFLLGELPPSELLLFLNLFRLDVSRRHRTQEGAYGKKLSQLFS